MKTISRKPNVVFCNSFTQSPLSPNNDSGGASNPEKPNKFLVTLRPVPKFRDINGQPEQLKPLQFLTNDESLGRCSGKIICNKAGNVRIKANDSIQHKSILKAVRLLTNSKIVTFDRNYNQSVKSNLQIAPDDELRLEAGREAPRKQSRRGPPKSWTQNAPVSSSTPKKPNRESYTPRNIPYNNVNNTTLFSCLRNTEMENNTMEMVDNVSVPLLPPDPYARKASETIQKKDKQKSITKTKERENVQKRKSSGSHKACKIPSIEKLLLKDSDSSLVFAPQCKCPFLKCLRKSKCCKRNRNPKGSVDNVDSSYEPTSKKKDSKPLEDLSSSSSSSRECSFHEIPRDCDYSYNDEQRKQLERMKKCSILVSREKGKFTKKDAYVVTPCALPLLNKPDYVQECNAVSKEQEKEQMSRRDTPYPEVESVESCDEYEEDNDSMESCFSDELQTTVLEKSASPPACGFANEANCTILTKEPSPPPSGFASEANTTVLSQSPSSELTSPVKTKTEAILAEPSVAESSESSSDDVNDKSCKLDCKRIASLEHQIEDMRKELRCIREELIPEEEKGHYSMLAKRLEELTAQLSDMRENIRQETEQKCTYYSEHGRAVREAAGANFPSSAGVGIDSHYYVTQRHNSRSDREVSGNEKTLNKKDSYEHHKDKRKPMEKDKQKSMGEHSKLNNHYHEEKRMSKEVEIRTCKVNVDRRAVCQKPKFSPGNHSSNSPIPMCPVAVNPPNTSKPATTNRQVEHALDRSGSLSFHSFSDENQQFSNANHTESPKKESVMCSIKRDHHVVRPVTTRPDPKKKSLPRATMTEERPPAPLQQQRASFHQATMTEESFPEMNAASSYCIFCFNQKTNVVYSNLHLEIERLMRGYNSSEVALTILLQTDNYYHINMSIIKTGVPLGCIYTTEVGIDEANSKRLFENFLTFFVVDSKNTPEQKHKILSHTFEFIK